MTDGSGDSPGASRKQDRTGRTIAIVLLLSGSLAGAFFVYLSRTMHVTLEPVPLPEALRAPPEPSPLLGVNLVATAFVESIAAHRFADAYRLMAAPYREAVAEKDFTKACRESKFLVGATSARLTGMTETVAPADGGPAWSATPVDGGLGQAAIVRTQATFVTDQGLVAGEVVFLRQPDEDRILTLSIEGIPVLQAAAAKRP